jgi:phytoene dehydrogenase-like protein
MKTSAATTKKQFDYIVVGSGLSGLVFAALAAKKGNSVLVLEAHEHTGGYGHTFQMGKSAKFNAQLHYVWNCGEGETVNQVLQELSLDQSVTFETLDPDGFDRMVMPGYSLKIPSNNAKLASRIDHLFPGQKEPAAAFLKRVESVASGLDLVASPFSLPKVLAQGIDAIRVTKYTKSTLQDVFNEFGLDQRVQTLLASQWPDFLLPPDQLSFFAWVMLFTGYQKGAYYPTHHFEHVIDSLVTVIEESGSVILLEHEVTSFIEQGSKVTGVRGKSLTTGTDFQYTGNEIVCNMDPQRVGKMLGMKKFAKKQQKQLDYDYSPSNLMVYCTVRDLDLESLGFGRWNTFHSGDDNLNVAFRRMYEHHDYSNPSFAITTPGLMTNDSSDRPDGEQIIELLTVADFKYFDELHKRSRAEYLKKKKQIMNQLFDVVEELYIPDFRAHLTFKIIGTPTTNERFCWSPEGHSYGSNMTPNNISLGRLNHESSIEGLWFCCASAGFAGFAGSFWTGKQLYEKLMRKN